MDKQPAIAESMTVFCFVSSLVLKRALRVTVGVTLVATALLAAPGETLLGHKPEPWSQVTWLNSKPLHLPELAGKVVLIRWWTAPGCPYCRATAPALNEFHQTYGDRGLQVIGFYHHKSAAPLDPADVMRQAVRYGFEFPIAIDPDWQTLKRWWLRQGDEQWTSVSFLLDRRGVVRHIHPGGQYVKGDADYRAMRAKIEELLAEK